MIGAAVVIVMLLAVAVFVIGLPIVVGIVAYQHRRAMRAARTYRTR